MKKIVLLISLFISLSIGSAWAQQYAFIDMEYILNRIPSFENANEQIEDLSKQWQGTIDNEVEVANANDMNGILKNPYNFLEAV